MHLIDNVDLVAALGRLVPGIFDDLSHLIDSPVGGTIDLENIHGVSIDDLRTMAALVAWIGCGPLFTIQGLGNDPGYRGFSYPPHTC